MLKGQCPITTLVHRGLAPAGKHIEWGRARGRVTELFNKVVLMVGLLCAQLRVVLSLRERIIYLRR